jgi:glucose-1-phosphate thymidylyltransferase
VVYTNQRILDIKKDSEHLIDSTATIEQSTIIEPCYIGPNVHISNSVVGPYVSVGENSKLENCVIKNSLIQNDSVVKNVIAEDSMLGNKANFEAKPRILSLGDYTNYSE